MFWTIVGALLLVFVGLPLAYGLLIELAQSYHEWRRSIAGSRAGQFLARLRTRP